MRRREFVFGLTASTIAHIPATSWAETNAGIATLDVGSYIWRPELSPEGSVVVVVSLPEQLVHVYRNGMAIGVSTCSTGKRGHRTPTGVFTILQKHRRHFSSTYNNAPMPNMQRLTWRGVALHAGNLPGYPASHGCIRLPREFSKLLFEVTHIGTAVIIVDQKTDYQSIIHPRLILDPTIASIAAQAETKKSGKKLNGWAATVKRNVATILISRADRTAYLMVDGELANKTRILISRPEQPLGHNLYSLVGKSETSNALVWHVYGFHAHERNSASITRRTDPTLSRISFPDEERVRQVAETLQPGTTMLITDFPANPESRSDPDFTVIVEDKTKKGRRHAG